MYLMEDTKYPLVSSFLRLNTFLNRMKEIKKFHPQIKETEVQPQIEHLGTFESKYFNPKKYKILIENSKYTLRYTQIVDIFQEEQIIRAHYNGKLSLHEAFEDNKELIDKTDDPIKKRQMLHTITKSISRFRPTLMVALIKIYRPRYILDFCSGWGDRLLGALVYDNKIKYYCGIDPNKKLFNSYEVMIKSFIPEKSNRQKYNMICDCAEDCDIPKSPAKNKTYDMVITSPPYYDHEVYSDDTNQSAKKYDSLETWFDNFLLKASHNAINNLSEDGYFIISINDTNKYQYTLKYFEAITSLSNMQFVDLYHTIDDVHYKKYNTQQEKLVCQPIFVWQKKSPK